MFRSRPRLLNQSKSARRPNGQLANLGLTLSLCARAASSRDAEMLMHAMTRQLPENPKHGWRHPRRSVSLPPQRKPMSAAAAAARAARLLLPCLPQTTTTRLLHASTRAPAPAPAPSHLPLISSDRASHSRQIAFLILTSTVACRCFAGSGAGSVRELHPPRRRRPPRCGHRPGESSRVLVRQIKSLPRAFSTNKKPPTHWSLAALIRYSGGANHVPALHLCVFWWDCRCLGCSIRLMQGVCLLVISVCLPDTNANNPR